MKRLTGRHVFLLLLGFFGMTIAVNVAMSIWAVRTFSGEVATNSYLRGLHYNDTLAARQMQQAEGWHAVITALRDPHGAARLLLILSGRDGQPVRGLTLEGVLSLPATEHEDKRFVLHESAPGRYEASLAPVRAAVWDVDIETPSPGENDEDTPRFETRNRLWIR